MADEILHCKNNPVSGGFEKKILIKMICGGGGTEKFLVQSRSLSKIFCLVSF